MADDFSINVEFEKVENEGRFVRGFASVVTKGGKPVRDHQGDRIEIEDMRKAAHNFIREARVAKAMHKGGQIGEVVEAVMIDDEFAKALGVSDDRRGLWITMQITDPDVQKRVAEKELKAFSIGGRGKRTKEADDEA